MKHGVPQGTVLGSLLFVIYINDLHNAISHSQSHYFADDTHLLNTNNSPKKVQKQLDVDLKLLCSWLLANKISLNSKKWKLSFFRNLVVNLSVTGIYVLMATNQDQWMK